MRLVAVTTSTNARGTFVKSSTTRDFEMGVAIAFIVAAIAGGAIGYRLCLEFNKGMAIPWFID